MAIRVGRRALNPAEADAVVMRRVVVGGCVVLGPPLAVTPRLYINPQTLRYRNGGCAWLARAVVQHLHTRSSYRTTIPGCSFPLQSI
jgi:hypothetical protein